MPAGQDRLRVACKLPALRKQPIEALDRRGPGDYGAARLI